MFKMIIIDDEAIIRESLNRFIDWASIDVTITGVVANGSQALDLILKDTPDIILSDINMPMLSGIELLELLKDHHIPTKVIFISAYSKFEYAQAALRLGAFDYILKPINEEKVLQTVKDCTTSILNDRQESTILETLKKDSSTQFISLLQHLYYDEHYETSRADAEILKESRLFSGKYQTMISAGFWYPKELTLPIQDYQLLFCNLSYEIKVFTFILENNIHALLILAEIPDPDQLYHDVETSLFYAQEEYSKGESRPDISLSESYPVRQCIHHLYTEITLAHLLLKSNEHISRFRHVLRNSKRLSANTNPPLPAFSQLIKENNRQKILDTLDLIFYNFVKEEHIYDLDNLKMDLIHKIDYTINELKEFQQHDELYTSTLSSKKTINAQHSIDSLYEVTQNMILNLCDYINRLSDRGVTQFVRSTLDYIHANYAKDLSLTEVADRLYVTPTYLSKIFSTEMNQPFSKYILEYRIKKSVELLSIPKLKIYDIANMCGFSDIAHFSKTFKQIMGMSPHKYRNTHL